MSDVDRAAGWLVSASSMQDITLSAPCCTAAADIDTSKGWPTLGDLIEIAGEHRCVIPHG